MNEILAQWWCKFIHSHRNWVKLRNVDHRARDDIWHCIKCGRNWVSE